MRKRYKGAYGGLPLFRHYPTSAVENAILRLSK